MQMQYIKSSYVTQLSNPDDVAVIEFEVSPMGYVVILSIKVPVEHRGKGVGRELLAKVCKAADLSGQTLKLYPLSSGEMTTPQLVEWYRRNGFVKTSEAAYMTRRPTGGRNGRTEAAPGNVFAMAGETTGPG